MKQCPNKCMITPLAEDKFCYKCGDELVFTKCGCGRELTLVDTFCPSCGKGIE